MYIQCSFVLPKPLAGTPTLSWHIILWITVITIKNIFERDLHNTVFILRSHEINNIETFKILHKYNIVAPSGVSSSGSSFKHPGRVGDSPLPGSGLYADDEVQCTKESYLQYL